LKESVKTFPDISRGRFVLRILEQVYEEKKQKNGVEQRTVRVEEMHHPVYYATVFTSEPQSTSKSVCMMDNSIEAKDLSKDFAFTKCYCKA
jgi:hypothetical protein